jgi:hypothetical protein
MKWRHAIPSDAKAEPCPFCGAEQDVIVVLSPYENRGPFWVECGQCHAQGSETQAATLAGVNEAIALWNTRAPSYPTIAFDDPRFKEWEKDLGPAIVTAQEARINALEEAAKIADAEAYANVSVSADCPGVDHREYSHRAETARTIAAAIRAAK